jgi:hypothetical protein
MGRSDAAAKPVPEVAADPRFDRVQWRIERIGWLLMGLLLIVALLGFLGGGGPLTGTTDSAGEARVHYYRVVRFQGQDRLQLALPAEEQQATVTFNQPFLDGMEVEDVEPQPDSVEAGKEGVTYVFNVAEGERAADVSFTLRPQHIGFHKARLETSAGVLSVRQFAVP